MTYPNMRGRQAAEIASRMASLKRLLGALLLVLGTIWLALTFAGVRIW
jgi:hypothetical protein